MGQITSRGQSTFGGGSATLVNTCSLDIPAAAQVGDLAVVHVVRQEAITTFTEPSGWAADAFTFTNTGLGRTNSVLWVTWKILTLADLGTTPVFTLTAPTSVVAGIMEVFYDWESQVAGAAGTPFGTTTATASTFTTSAASASLTSVFYGQRLLGCWSALTDTAAAAEITLPAGFSGGVQVKTAITDFTSHSNVTLRTGWRDVTYPVSNGPYVATTDIASTSLVRLEAIRSTPLPPGPPVWDGTYLSDSVIARTALVPILPGGAPVVGQLWP